jgi:hypothetical protein
MIQLKTNPIVQTHYKKNGIIALKKHVDANHAMLAKRFEEVNSPLRDVLEKKPTRKRPNVCNFKLSKFFGAKDLFKKDVQRKQVLQNLALLVVRKHFPIQFVESTWLRCLIMHLCPRVVFPIKTIIFTKGFG